MWSNSKLILLVSTLLLQAGVANASCWFCLGGTVSKSEEPFALSDPNVEYTCQEWQAKPKLTATYSAAACDFIAPFYNAKCGCSTTATKHDECHLCGDDTLEFKKPNKGLVIPNSRGQEVLCRTIYEGVQQGAVPAKDCQVLAGIKDYCGGCIAVEPEQKYDARKDVLISRTTPFGGRTSEGTPTIAPTQPPTLETFVGEIAKFPEIGEATIAEAMTAPPSTADPTSSPTSSPSSVPSDGPSMEPTTSPTDSPSDMPSDGPSMEPSTSPTANPSDMPSDGPSMEPSTSPTTSPSGMPSDGPSLEPSTSPTTSPSSSPTVSHTASPTNSPTVSTMPSDGPSMDPTGIPTGSAAPTMEVIVALNLSTMDPSGSPSSAPSDGPSMTPSTSPSFSPSVASIVREAIITESESTYVCDLCPDGSLEHPSKLMSLVSMGNQTVTKTCGALLWDARSGKNDMDESGCSFVKAFFGAICGCSTFTPFSHTDKIEHKVCKLCDKHDHVFQAVHKPLPIPGSDNTEITCGGVYAGAVDGAVTDSECKALATIADHCGGCGVENATFYELFEEPVVAPKQCVDCLGDKESSIYVYKDFGSSGTTFHKAFNAPSYCDDKKKPIKQKDCARLEYPELEGCVLTPITSFEELLRVQAVIPPGKAAYTAVTKDSLVLKTEAKECYESTDNHGIEVADIQISRTSIMRKGDCKVENWMEGLTYGLDDYGGKAQKLAKLNNLTVVDDPCESMKTGWVNYKAGTDVPSKLWENGKLSYCSKGPVQDVGGVWAVEGNGQNYGDLRDVSMNWPLPGAVYKCCKTIYSCFEGPK